MSSLFDFDEDAVKHLLPANFDDIAYKAFKKFDKDGNDVIDRSELRIIFQDIQKKLNINEEVTDEDITEAIGQLDKNNNNVLEFDEFRKLFIGLYIIQN
jgi:Ca2+-binding EF-hand superfamily protein